MQFAAANGVAENKAGKLMEVFSEELYGYKLLNIPSARTVGRTTTEAAAISQRQITEAAFGAERLCVGHDGTPYQQEDYQGFTVHTSKGESLSLGAHLVRSKKAQRGLDTLIYAINTATNTSAKLGGPIMSLDDFLSKISSTISDSASGEKSLNNLLENLIKQLPRNEQKRLYSLFCKMHHISGYLKAMTRPKEWKHVSLVSGLHSSGKHASMRWCVCVCVCECLSIPLVCLCE